MFFDTVAEKRDDFSAQVDPVERRDDVHNGLDDLRQVGDQRRDRVDKPLAQRDNQLDARHQQFRRIVVDDARNVGHDARDVLDHRRQPIHQALRHV